MPLYHIWEFCNSYDRAPKQTIMTPPCQVQTYPPNYSDQSSSRRKDLLHSSCSSYALLQCYTVHCAAQQCNVIPCTALHCNIIPCTPLHCNVIPCTSLHCTDLMCTALHCTALPYTALLFAATCSSEQLSS